MAFLLPSLAALIALLILPGWSFYFEVTPKVVVVLLAAAAAIPFLRWPDGKRARWILGLIAAQAITIALATLFSTNRWRSFYGSTWRKDGMLVEIAVLVFAAAAVGQFSDRARMKIWLRITIAASIPISIYTLLQYLGIDPIFPPNAYHFGEGRFMIVRPPSTLGHAAYLATYLLYVVFAGIALTRQELSRWWKWIAVAATALGLFALVLSGTRAALVGLVAGLIFVAFRDASRPNWLGWSGVAIFVFVVFYISPLGERLRARAFWSSEDALGGARLMLWRDTARMSADHLALGFGPETFSREFPKHQSIELARAFPDFYQESPHNIFLDALISRGLIGLVPLLILAGIGMVARNWLGGGFVAMGVSQQFAAFTVPTELFFYLCLAMALRENQEAPLRIAAQRRNWPAYLAAICLFALPFICFAIYLETGDVLLTDARRALDRGDAGSAAGFENRARGWSSAADIYFSRRFLALVPSDTIGSLLVLQYAMQAARNAPVSADDPQNAWINQAALDATVNDAPGVEQSLREAIAIAPNWYKPHWLLAQVLDRMGRKAEARAEARLALDRDGGKHVEVKRVLEQLEGAN
jgi:O-antigen ligase